MSKINTAIIAALNPCEDRFNNWKKHYNNFDAHILEFLELESITAIDKIWVAVRILPQQLLETFALDCAVSARQYAFDTAAYAADAAAAADIAAYAAAYTATYTAAAASPAAYTAAAAAERENQVDALIVLIKEYSL